MKKLFLASACLFLMPIMATAQVNDDNSTCLSVDCEPGIDAMVEQQFQDSYDRSLGEILNDLGMSGYGLDHKTPKELLDCQSLCVTHYNENVGTCVALIMRGAPDPETIEEDRAYNNEKARAASQCSEFFGGELTSCMVKCNK